MLGFGGGLTVGYAKGEFAITLNAGAGYAEGVTLDRRTTENGRMAPVEATGKPALAGVTVAGYAKGGVEGGTPVGGVNLGQKVGGGVDLVTGQKVGGKSDEVGLVLSSNKLGASASAQGGVEVSVYIRPGDIAAKAGEKIVETLKPLVKPIADQVKKLEPHP